MENEAGNANEERAFIAGAIIGRLDWRVESETRKMKARVRTDHGGAARHRGLSANLEVIDGDGAHEGQLEVRVRVDPALSEPKSNRDSFIQEKKKRNGTSAQQQRPNETS